MLLLCNIIAGRPPRPSRSAPKSKKGRPAAVHACAMPCRGSPRPFCTLPAPYNAPRPSPGFAAPVAPAVAGSRPDRPRVARIAPDRVGLRPPALPWTPCALSRQPWPAAPDFPEQAAKFPGQFPGAEFPGRTRGGEKLAGLRGRSRTVRTGRLQKLAGIGASAVGAAIPAGHAVSRPRCTLTITRTHWQKPLKTAAVCAFFLPKSGIRLDPHTVFAAFSPKIPRFLQFAAKLRPKILPPLRKPSPRLAGKPRAYLFTPRIYVKFIGQLHKSRGNWRPGELQEILAARKSARPPGNCTFSGELQNLGIFKESGELQNLPTSEKSDRPGSCTLSHPLKFARICLFPSVCRVFPRRPSTHTTEKNHAAERAELRNKEIYQNCHSQNCFLVQNCQEYCFANFFLDFCSVRGIIKA